MAIIVANISITNDTASSTITVTQPMTLYKAGTTTGVEQTSRMARRVLLTSETSLTDLISADGEFTYTANKANKVYICNSSTSDTDFILITIHGEPIGKLFAGDWMVMPWSASDTYSDIRITANGSGSGQTTTTIVDYMVIGEGNTA